MDRTLIVGAHAMDSELMAGAIAKVAADQGDEVILLHLTRGERGHPKKSAGVFGKQLEIEMARAAEVLGVKQVWAGFPAPLPPPAEVAPVIAAAISRYQIGTVITHWSGSWHASHRRAHHATIAAVKSIEDPVALFYAENCEDLTGFLPAYFVPVESTFEPWIKALGAYELFRRSKPGSREPSQIPYWAYYTAAARVRGLQSGVGFAQALMPGNGSLPPSFNARRVSLEEVISLF